MRVRFRDLPHLVKGNFTENNFLETDSTDNKIHCNLSVNSYGDKPVIDGCTLFLPASTRGNIIVNLGDDDSQITFGQNIVCTIDFRIWRRSTVYIGNNTTCNGARVVTDNSDVFIGEDCLISDEILIQSNDQHGLIDLDSQTIINGGRRSVIIGDHVWLGRRSTIMPDVRIGPGAVIGAGAVVVKDVEPFSYTAGVPARKVRERSSWTRNPTEASPREIAFFQANGFPIGKPA